MRTIKENEGIQKRPITAVRSAPQADLLQTTGRGTALQKEVGGWLTLVCILLNNEDN